MLPLRKKNMLRKEIQASEMHQAPLEWNFQVSGRGTEHLQQGIGGSAEEFSLFYQEMSPDSAGEQLEREGKGFAMKP